VEEAVTRALQGGQPFEMDYRIVRPDGRVRIVHARCEPLLNDLGKVVRLVGTAQDVTDVRLGEVATSRPALRDSQPSLQLILGARQLEILELIADGLSNIEIADRLFISEATVKWHVRQILRKLGATNRAQAVARLGPAG
jgi:DNA-binding NarL/FixJ family response regulator